METRLRILAPQLSVVLFQLPPQFVRDTERLGKFLDMLPRKRRYAFEFRHPSWYDDTVFNLLRRKSVSLCVSDHADAPSPWIATADHIYIRGHGPRGNYSGSYTSSTLRRWVEHIRIWRTQGHDIFAYFDNDQKGAAPKDAQRLNRMLADL